ncbi:MAG: M28 family peptidase [Candidatus Heimdallarchaeota archaeon]
MLSTGKNDDVVDINRLYNHILSLEGIKHSLDSFDALVQGAEYIEKTLQQYGLATNRKFFPVKGLNKEFYNVEGVLEKDMDHSKPTLLVTSHFDTVYTTPGADDNASGVAAMLEVARVLKERNYDKNVIFVSFNLEEFSPELQSEIRKVGKELSIYDESFRFRSWPLKKYASVFKQQIIAKGPVKGFLDDQEWIKFAADAQSELTESELLFFEEQNRIFRESAQDDPFGRSFCLGSNAYSKYVVEKKMNVAGVVNLESIGFTSSKPNSQTFPEGVRLDMFETHDIDAEQMLGNFITVFSDANSKELASAFFAATKRDTVSLPCAVLAVPLNYQEIKQNMPDLLRSDHAPFWRCNIPAIMITDTATFRNPYYHTGGDTINTLDFPFMKKVCQATLATISAYQNK